MKKIGFIDYYISEWHANNYPNWIGEYVKDAGLDYKVEYAYAEIDKSPVDGLTTDEWCAKFGVKKVDTIKELVEKSDYIIILAPTNPETHLRLCKEAFKYANGKRIYVDKTFAPDYKTAVEIFKIASEYNVKFFSTSALRYSPFVIENLNAKNLATKFGGTTIEEYIIHQVETIVKFYGVGANKVKAQLIDGAYKFEIAFDNGKVGVMNFKEDNGYNIIVEDNSVKVNEIKLTGGHFQGLIKKIITFFESGEIDFDVKEILEVMKIRDASLIAKDNLNTWIEIQKN